MRQKWIGLLTAVLLAGVPAFSAAAETGSPTLLLAEARRTDTLSARHGSAAVQSRIASDFTAFAGSDANAESLVTGLRNGTPITLSSTSTVRGAGASTTPLTFAPPTRPMGHGNVFISLALARHQLAGLGINNPTPQEIQAALAGGTITATNGQLVTLQGVLTQRANGQGWGTIANAQGTRLGHIVSALKSANQQVNATPTVIGGGRGAAAPASGPSTASTVTHTTAAGGRTLPTHGWGADSARGVVSTDGGMAAGASAGARTGGIVSGAGAPAHGSVGAPGLAKGHSRP